MLLPGEQELAKQLLAITKTAREQGKTIHEQGSILHKLGELYLKNAIETGNGEQFVKASALINAALVRTENPNDQKKLQGLICNIYNGLLKDIHGSSQLSVEEVYEKANCNKDSLHRIRVDTNKMCKDLKELMYSCGHNPVFNLKETLKEIDKEVHKVSPKVQSGMKDFVERLWKQATKMFPISAPCEYAVIGFGSLARQEITPYSDLEFALLIETDTEENKQYFKKLVYLFHLLVLDLGETPVPTMAIESLNDFLSSDGDKYFDIITPCGFRLDGAMPWACKTPIGRKETSCRKPLDLIKTPKDMAALLREDNELGQAYHVADTLCNSIWICGNLGVFEAYTELGNIALTDIDHKAKASRSMMSDYEKSPNYNIKRCCDYNLQTKTVFYRFPSTFVENLRMHFTPNYKARSNWEVLDNLLQANILSQKGTFRLKIWLSIGYGLRLLTYLENRGQCENFGFFWKRKEKPFEKERSRNPSTARPGSRLAFVGNQELMEIMVTGCKGIRYAIEKHFMDTTNQVHDLREEDFYYDDRGLVFCPMSWEVNQYILGNLQWAIMSRELSPNGCGHTCQVLRLKTFSRIPKFDYTSMLKDLDEILEIKDCICLSLLNTNLLVTKACLYLLTDQVENVPKEANILELIKSYKEKKYKNLRERFYLLVDIVQLSNLIRNESVLSNILKEVKFFVDNISTFKETQIGVVNMVKDDLIEALIMLYMKTGQVKEGIELCQQQIDKSEMEYGVRGGTTIMARWYLSMGILKMSRPSESLYYLEKSYDIFLNAHKFYCPIEVSSSYIGNESVRRRYQESAQNADLGFVRLPAYLLASLYKDDQRYKDVMKILFEVLTVNGQSLGIETDEDVKALCLLSVSCKESQSDEYIQRGNRYFEEILEMIIAKGDHHHFSVNTVLEIMQTIREWNARDGKLKFEKKCNTTYVIEDTYKKYCTRKGETLTKTEFLIKVMGMMLDNHSLQQSILRSAHLQNNLYYHTSSLEVDNERWLGFFFDLCKLSMHKGVVVNTFVSQRSEFRRASLHQAGVFCEKVVQKIVPKDIYKMFLIYIDFHRVRMDFFDFSFTQDPRYIQSAKELAEKTNSNLRRFFPGCFKALMMINMIEIYDPTPAL